MIKKLISKLFGIKQCACPEDMDKPIVLENETPVEKLWECGTHSRYKKSCSICRELAGVA
jgi:hypothetical protein